MWKATKNLNVTSSEYIQQFLKANEIAEEKEVAVFVDCNWGAKIWLLKSLYTRAAESEEF